MKTAAALKLCPDAFIVFENGAWIATNPHARAHVALSPSALELLRRAASGSTDTAGLSELWAEDRTIFSCRRCLLDDATGMEREEKAGKVEGAEAVLAKLKERSILVEDVEAYRARFGPKTRPVGDDHFGTFHQQMGHEIAFRQRKSPDEWWVAQKFTDDLSGIKNTAYKKVQESFLKRQAPHWNLKGKKALDIGCGVGFYSNFFASFGAEVLGIDPNKAYIERARKTFKGPTFEVFDFTDPSKLASLGEGKFDFIYVADVLLFYFLPYKGGTGDPVSLLKALRKLLAPNGRIITMDPHGAFSLCARYGDPDKPVAVVTEYKNKKFGITPNLESMAHSFRASDLRVVDVWEPCFEAEKNSAREDGFLREFPTWWVFELAAAN